MILKTMANMLFYSRSSHKLLGVCSSIRTFIQKTPKCKQICLTSKSTRALSCLLCQGHSHTFHPNPSVRQSLKWCHSQSEASDAEPDPRQSSRRNRILAYVGGFVLIHLSIVFARRKSKSKEDMGIHSVASPQSSSQEYIDPDLGRTAKMFYHKDYLLPFFAKESVELIEEFKVKENDIFVASFPKSGTTWIQEIVYLIETGLDIKSSSEENMEQRFPYLEYVYPGVKEISHRKGQRLIKTHMPHSLLPAEARAGKGKVIYIARNPKDVSVSYFHYIRMLSEVAFDGSFESFFNKFVNDKVAYGPWWKHVVDYWNHREDTNILFLTYEEMHKDLNGSIAKIAKFLGKDLTGAQVAAVAGRCSFATMKQNPASNYSWWDDLGLRRKWEAAFMRKGVVGDWRNYYSTEMSQKVDEICQKQLEPNGIQLMDNLK